jgi:Lhr-like helicase
MYLKQEELNNLSISQIMQLKPEAETIRKLNEVFVSYAEQVEGSISATYASRFVNKFTAAKKAYKRIVDMIGKENVEMIVATNTFRFTFTRKDVNVKKTHKRILREFDINSLEDLDLRYIVKSRDYFIFWESILYIMSVVNEEEYDNTLKTTYEARDGQLYFPI